MKKSDLLKLLENITDEQDVDDSLKGTDLAKALSDGVITLDAFKEKIKTDKEFKSYFESENDKYHNKALKTWKDNNLEKELEPFIQEKFPELVTDPTQKKLLELEKELQKERNANARKDLLSQAVKYAGEKKIPADFIEKLLDEDFDKTKSTIDSFAEAWSKGLEGLVEEKLKSTSYTPGGTNPDGSNISLGQKMASQRNESQPTAPNPWGK